MAKYNKLDMIEYRQWLQDTGRSTYGLTDIYVNDNGNIKIEKRMAWSCHVTPNDWKEFCNATNRIYDGDITLMAIISE